MKRPLACITDDCNNVAKRRVPNSFYDITELYAADTNKMEIALPQQPQHAIAAPVTTPPTNPVFLRPQPQKSAPSAAESRPDAVWMANCSSCVLFRPTWVSKPAVVNLTCANCARLTCVACLVACAHCATPVCGNCSYGVTSGFVEYRICPNCESLAR